jgi:hypothetical protein
MSNFNYYKISFKLKTPMLGTATQGSIYYEHVIEKAKKEIAKANKLSEKINKALDKYKGSEITEDKTVSELKAVTRTFCQLMGRALDVPETVEELLEVNKQLEEEFHERLKNNDTVSCTVFLRDAEGYPIISSHMVLGNLKENLRIMVNNGDKGILQSKVSVGETMALDVKPVSDYMRPSNDILRAETEAQVPIAHKGKNIRLQDGRVVLERPIRFNRMGKEETAISMSEQLPEGTEFETIVRIRNNSSITEDAIKQLLDFGKSNGLGAWRGSGNCGSYFYKLEKLEDYQEETPEGWS